jgi:hypothetical protein
MASGISQSGSAKASRSYTFPYRAGMGIVPSSEFNVFFDDFTGAVTTNVPVGWDLAIIDAGATATSSTTAILGATGALLLSDATLSEGVAVAGEKALQLTVGKKFFMEMRVQTDDVTDNAIQFGLSSLTAVVNPEDLWTTVATDVLTVGILDGSALVGIFADAGNTGTVALAGTRSMVANTWHTLGLFYDGNKAYAYVDGKLSIQWVGVLPTGVALAPFFGVLNGNGAGANVNTIDFVRYVQER